MMRFLTKAGDSGGTNTIVNTVKPKDTSVQP